MAGSDAPPAHPLVREAFPRTIRLVASAQLRDAVIDGKAFIDIALLEYLKNWLVEHILGSDKHYADYMNKNKSKSGSLIGRLFRRFF